MSICSWNTRSTTSRRITCLKTIRSRVSSWNNWKKRSKSWKGIANYMLSKRMIKTLTTFKIMLACFARNDIQSRMGIVDLHSVQQFVLQKALSNDLLSADEEKLIDSLNRLVCHFELFVEITSDTECRIYRKW